MKLLVKKELALLAKVEMCLFLSQGLQKNFAEHRKASREASPVVP